VATLALINKAIKSEERALNKRKTERAEKRSFEGNVAIGAGSVVGAGLAAVHDRLRGKPSESPSPGGIPLEPAKFGPVPANLAIGAAVLGAALMMPRGWGAIRHGIGGAGIGTLNAGVYRATYDNLPESEG
jgi:hypothetical protein